MKYIDLKNKKEQEFIREVGITRSLFEIYSNKLNNKINENKRGNKSILSAEDQIFIFMQRIRHGRTFDSIAIDYNLVRATPCKVFHRIKNFFRELSDQDINDSEKLNKDNSTFLTDITEIIIKKPRKNQKDFYSGKKKNIR